MRLEDIVATIDGAHVRVTLSEDDGWWEFSPVDADDEASIEAAAKASDLQATYRDAQFGRDEGAGGLASVDPWDRLVEWLRNMFGNDCVTYRKVAEEGDEGKVY